MKGWGAVEQARKGNKKTKKCQKVPKYNIYS